MNIGTIVSRLQDMDNQLKTISSLRKIQDMHGKSAKLCTCRHPRPQSVSRPGKSESRRREKKESHCSCQWKPKCCPCSYGSDDQSTIVKLKESDAEEDNERMTHSVPRSNLKRGIVTTMETSDRVGEQQRRDEKPENINESEGKTVKHSHTLNVDNSKSDEQNFEQMYKELKKQNVALEEKLEKMDCSMNCLKDEGDKQAACLKDALEKAKNEAKLAARSRNLAMDLAKQSRDQTELVKASRDELANEINLVKSNNIKLECECNELKCKLRVIMENEAKKCAEVDENVNRIKCAVKQKETALIDEKGELEKTVAELTKHVKVQKKRICELTSMCTKQRDLLRENENCISTKIAQLTEAESKFQSTNCKCRQMQEQIDDLKCRLNDETIARDTLQKELDNRQDDCNCQLKIKDKIIVDQVETIKKLKKLLQDSERMAHEAARQFESLRDELRCLKQSEATLQIALNEAEGQLMENYETKYCDHCNLLKTQIDNIEEQRQKAITAAKFAATKLCDCTMEYQRQLDCEKRRNAYVTELMKRQAAEIILLKKEILCVKEFRSRRSTVYTDHK